MLIFFKENISIFYFLLLLDNDYLLQAYWTLFNFLFYNIKFQKKN